MPSSARPTAITKFDGNIAGEGGGMFVRGPGTRKLSNVEFYRNQAQSPNSGGGETGGGGFHAENSDRVILVNCAFGNPLDALSGNRATQADGGGILSELTSMEVINSRFSFNSAATGSGGAARMSGSQRSLLRQCVAESNSATIGGGISVDNNADVAFDDCALRLNTAATTGGGLFLGGGRPFIYNCVLTGNTAAAGSGIFNNGAGTAVLHTTIADIRGAGRAIQFGAKPSDQVIVQNSIVGDEWDTDLNGVPVADRAFDLVRPAYLIVRYTDVEMVDIASFNATIGYFANINCDPLFENLPTGDVHLTECSPCIDRANRDQSDNLFNFTPSQWDPLLTEFFTIEGLPARCNDLLGRCRGDFDDFTDAGQDPDDLDNDGFNDLDGNPVVRNTFAQNQTYPGRPQTFRPLACQSDMGADEFLRVLEDSLQVYCDPDGDGPIEPSFPDPDTLRCEARCAGDPFCFRSEFIGQCPAGVSYQWYFRPDQPGAPATCADSIDGYMLIPGATSPDLCFPTLEQSDAGCYKLVITRSSCLGPFGFYPPLGFRGITTFNCPDHVLAPCVCTLEACICLEVLPGPEPEIESKAVCVGGRQTLAQIATLPTLPAGYIYTYRWFFRGESNCLATPCPEGECSGGEQLANGLQDSGMVVSGATTDTLVLTDVQFVNRGCYYVYVDIDGPDEGTEPDGSDCARASNCACLVVVAPQPVVNNAAVCTGGNQTLEQTAALPPLPPDYVYTFQWYFRGTSDCLAAPCPGGVCEGGTPVVNGGRFSGATSQNLTITGALAADAGCYYIVVGINGPEGDQIDALKCARPSNCACLTVVNPQPVVANAAVCAGGQQCLEITTLPLLPPNYSYTFQWFRRPGSNCLAVPCPNGDCTGGTPLTNSGGFSGVTTNTLCINPADATHQGCYYVQVGIDGPEGAGIDAAKCVRFSNCACLTVVNPQPSVNNAAVCVGGNQTLEQTATLPGLPLGYSYTYQWFFRGTSNCLITPCDAGECAGGNPVNNGGRFSGATSPALTITGAIAADAGCYYVRVGIDGPEGTAIDAAKCLRNSNCACLVVVDPDPAVNNAAVCIGGTQTLEQTATLPTLPNGYVYTYQWFFRGTSNCVTTPCDAGDCAGGNQVNNGGRFSGATSPMLTITGATAADAGCYYVRVGIDGPESPSIDLAKCLRTSNCACLSVINPQPFVANAAVCIGGRQCLEVSGLPTPPPNYSYTYQWFRRPESNCLTAPCPGGTCSGGTTISNGGGFSGVTSSILCIDPAMQSHQGCYYVQIGIDGPEGPGQDGPKCIAFSNCACLTVVNPVPIVANAAVCVTGDQCLSVNVAAFPALPATYSYTFQWWFVGTSDCFAAPCPAGTCTGGSPLGNNATYSGVTTPTLCITNAQLNHQGCYYVQVGINGPEDPAIDLAKCAVFSNCACLRVIQSPIFTVQPEDAVACVGGMTMISATVSNPSGATLCLQWYRKATCNDPGEGVPVVNGGGISGAMTSVLTFDPVALIHEGCYYLRARVCNPDDLDKCPWVDSDCACLNVLPPLEPCVLECASGQTDAEGKCLFCDRTRISLCCDVAGTTEPLCYQWQFKPNDDNPSTPFVDIPGANGQCFEFEFNAPNIGLPCGPGCYRVKINYTILSDDNCDGDDGVCNPVYSEPICIAETTECCPLECDCKDNADPDQEFYSLWRTGTWDGINGEWSFDRTASDGVIIKAADDLFLDQSCMHHIQRFLGEMLVKRANMLIEPQAKLVFFKDCNGAPGEMIGEFENEPCPAFLGSTPEGFNRYQFWFDLREECFWLRGGIYWVSLVGVGPVEDPGYEAFWVTAGLPSQTPERAECGQLPVGACCVGASCTIETSAACALLGGTWYPGSSCTANTCSGSPSTLLGKRPVFMDGASEWAEYDPCCHPCDDFVFCLSGKTCPIIWDNGLPFLGGADEDPPAAPPIQVFGTRSEKSTLTVRNSRAADQFILKTCTTEEVCYLEGYIFTNCTGFEVHLEIYENDCRQPQFSLPEGGPVYYPPSDPALRPVPEIIDLGYTGLRVGTVPVRAYKIVYCNWPSPLILEPGRNYWVSLSVRDTFSANERAFFAHIRQPCDPCDEPIVWKIDPGMELAPGRQIPDWQSAGEDFAFMIATKKQPETGPAGSPPPGSDCNVDINNNSIADVEDIFMFLSAWFAGCP